MILKIIDYLRLGLANITRVAYYRFTLWMRLHPIQWLKVPVARMPFFRSVDHVAPFISANIKWNDALWWFGWFDQPLPDSPPNWFGNPFSDIAQPDATHDWWHISDFDTGDIKGVWEISRFDWVVAWATCAVSGDVDALRRLNAWLADWAERNPPYKGPNWKCGQEASIRVMHLSLAAWLLGQERRPEAGLISLLSAHLQRIAPTMSYAIGQQNNHGTSEAAALFIGGSFLLGFDARAEHWMAKGRYWLEERAQALIEPDGSFSQYSVTYHRVMLDTYSLAEAWRRHRSLQAFSSKLSDRLAAASRWLEAMTDPTTGDAPNMGANDGARLIQLTSSDYRDFRPSVQLAAALFEGRDVYGAGAWNLPLQWLGVPIGQPSMMKESAAFDHGGYHILRKGQAMAVLRYPRFRFRPSHADALHLDFWLIGENVFRDGGTYGYNTEPKWLDYFPGTASHNTVQFDDRDQMPRLSRFLFGDWLKVKGVPIFFKSTKTDEAEVGYRDGWGAEHHRRVVLEAGRMQVVDQVSGFRSKAVLRWRLMPGAWLQQGNVLQLDDLWLTVEADVPIIRMEIVQGWESRYYLQKTPLPVLEIEVSRPGVIRSTIEWNS